MSFVIIIFFSLSVVVLIVCLYVQLWLVIKDKTVLNLCNIVCYCQLHM